MIKKCLLKYNLNQEEITFPAVAEFPEFQQFQLPDNFLEVSGSFDELNENTLTGDSFCFLDKGDQKA